MPSLGKYNSFYLFIYKMKNIYDFVKKDCFIKKIFELPLPPPPPELYPATIKPLDPQLVAMLGKLSRFTLRWQVLLMLGVIILHIILHMVHSLSNINITYMFGVNKTHTHPLHEPCNLQHWKTIRKLKRTSYNQS